MGRTIWEEVPASEIRPGDVLQWGSDPKDRVRVTDTYDTDPERVHDGHGNPARGISVAGPTEQFQRLCGVRTGKTYLPTQMVRRMVPERAARVADTNLRTMYDSAEARQEAEIRALESRQAQHNAQIMGQARDRYRDVSDPIGAYDDIARQLAPLYRARKERLGMPTDAETLAKADLSGLEQRIDVSTPETARATLTEAAQRAREVAADLTTEANTWTRKGDAAASSYHTAHLAPVFRQQAARAEADAQAITGTAAAWEQQAADIGSGGR